MIEVMEIAPVSAARSDSRYTALQLENVYRSMPRHSRRKKKTQPRMCADINYDAYSLFTKYNSSPQKAFRKSRHISTTYQMCGDSDSHSDAANRWSKLNINEQGMKHDTSS